MEKVPAEMMREFVRSQKFTSTDEVMTAMKNMFKDILQEVMECELADELGYEKSERTSNNECSNKSKNYRNGYSKKTIKTQMGELDIKVPRDRNGEYEPKIIGKYNRNVDGMEEKILSLYACGMSQRDIAEQIKNLYDVEISPELVSKISEKVMPDVTAWQNRPLEVVYPFVFMDAIQYKVKFEEQFYNAKGLKNAEEGKTAPMPKFETSVELLDPMAEVQKGSEVEEEKPAENSADENAALLAKLLSNPDTAALLKALAKTI